MNSKTQIHESAVIASHIARVPAREARSSFSDLVGRVGFAHERVVVTSSGRDAIALIPLSDLRTLEAMDAARKAHKGRSQKKMRASIEELLGLATKT